MNLVGWIVVGSIVGWVVSLATPSDDDAAMLVSIVAGSLGAVAGPLLLTAAGLAPVYGPAFSLGGLLASLGGALLLLAAVRWLPFWARPQPPAPAALDDETGDGTDTRPAAFSVAHETHGVGTREPVA